MIKNSSITQVKTRTGDAFKNYERKKGEELAVEVSVVDVEPEAKIQKYRSH